MNPSQIRSGAVWHDSNANLINAHSEGILHQKGLYDWYGEQRPEGSASLDALIGVGCYSSTDDNLVLCKS